MPKPTPKKTAAVETEGRPILYPEPFVRVAYGKDAITIAQMKELMGWQEETDDVKFGDNYLFEDLQGRKIRMANNIANRPLYFPNMEGLKQEKLQNRWGFNGEPIIIGKTGIVLNGQHTGPAFILAEQERTIGSDAEHWQTIHPEELTLEKVIVFGVDESDRVVNTMDTAKPRTLADAIYRSEFFAKMKSGDRKTAARMADYAIRMLWHRTGAGLDAFAPRRTHAESLDFLARHPRLLKAVKHVMEEDGDRKISKYLSPGYAAALHYLMGCCESNPEKYDKDRREQKLVWTTWDHAQEFWTLLASGDDMKELRLGLGRLVDPDTLGGGSVAEKMAMIIKAWLNHVAGKRVTEVTVRLDYVNRDGIEHLNEWPSVGGIDLGPNPAKEGEDDDAEDEGDGTDPTSEEIEARKQEIRDKKAGTVPPMDEKTKGDKADPLFEQLETIKAKHKDHVLLFKSPTGYTAWGDDAKLVSRLTNGKVQRHVSTDLDRLFFVSGKFKDVTDKLIHQFAVRVGVLSGDDYGTFEEVKVKSQPTPETPAGGAQEAKTPAPKPNPKKTPGPKLKGGIGS